MDSKVYDKEHIPEHARKGLTAMNEGRPLVQMESAEPGIILDRLLSGESVQAIATSYGIHRTAVYAWLLRNCPEQWMETQTAKQLSKLDDCEQVFDTAYSGDARKDGIDISRAREKTRLAQWHLERANRKLFGDTKAGLSLENNGIQTIQVVLAADSPLAQRLAQAGTGHVIQHDAIDDKG